MGSPPSTDRAAGFPLATCNGTNSPSRYPPMRRDLRATVDLSVDRPRSSRAPTVTLVIDRCASSISGLRNRRLRCDGIVDRNETVDDRVPGVLLADEPAVPLLHLPDIRGILD